MAKNDGGAAFPRTHKTTAPYGVDTQFSGAPGMSLRDYFIAHAPAEPPPWFKPVLPKLPAFPQWPDNLSVEEDAEAADWEGDAIGTEEITSERVRAVARQRDEFWEAKQSADQRERRERYLQWPIAWADEMLKRRAP